MHLMIFDPHERGHYLTYVRYLLETSTCAKRVTVVLRQDILASEPYREQLLPYIGNVEVVTSIQPASFNDGQQLLSDFSTSCAEHSPDHIWVPSGDLLARHCNLARLRGQWRFPAGTEAECGLIEIRFHHPPKRWRGYARRFLEQQLLRAGSWAKLHTIDPTVFTWIRDHGGKLATKFDLVPDPIDEFTPIEKIAARTALGIPEDGRYVGSVGSHAVARKGSHLLIESFAKARLATTDRLLLAGPLGDDLRHRLRTEYSELTRSGRLVAVDRYLSEIDLMNALSAMDLVCTPYIDHLGSSGIVLRAAQVGRPVLAPNQGWFATMIPRFGLGNTGDILEVANLARALEKAIPVAANYRRSAACLRLLEYSASSNFARLWARRLRERMGAPLDDRVRTWEWVLDAF